MIAGFLIVLARFAAIGVVLAIAAAIARTTRDTDDDPEPAVTYDDFLDQTTAHEARYTALEWSLQEPWNQPGGGQQR